MNENKSQQIKKTVTKIDISKIADYLQEHSTSSTLKEIIRYSKRTIDSNNEKEIFRLAVRVAYNLDTIVNKTDYVKDKEEKKHWLEISQEIFMNTLGEKK